MATDPERQEHARKLGQVVAKAWSDEAFKRRLLADPKAVLGEAGIAIPAEMEVRAFEDTERVHHLVLPRRPAEGELSEEQLEGAAGGAASACVCIAWSATT